ncbi:MAG: GNAT family N-acetyltransferase [Alteromonadaceae bacterium]|nr:GNAT family N-acetyltransferase [Alteromonadaceae bacterium]
MNKFELKNIVLSYDHRDMQLLVIHSYLTRSYWSKGISQALVAQAMDNSLCFGAFYQSKQIAFARVITDKTSFAYLADVFVLEEYQGLEVSKKLITFLMAHKDLQGLRRFMLCTADAHGLYQPFGFSAVKSPESLMAIHHADIYENN